MWMLVALRLPERARIVDLGGDEYYWHFFDHDFHVTIVNLPGTVRQPSDPCRYKLIEADACNLKDRFADGSFDAVFSNSVIEHVGDESQQAKFAVEVRRLAPAYWVQTPSTQFPYEVHTGIPFYWNLPTSARKAILNRWERHVPAWVEMVRGTRVLSRRRMSELFPDAQVKVERFFGLEKSYSFYRPHQPVQ
jgi:hypothetical protein